MAATSARASSAGPTDVLVLADGTRLRLRPLGSDDRDGVAALFARLSPESRYRRFLSPKRELTPRELSYFTDIDHLRHEAVAAIDQRDGSIVGVGRYVHVADRPNVADLAVEVTDELQNMGIGTELARYTVQRARDNGFALLTATTLWENRPARALLRRFEFHAYASDGSEIELELKLDSPSGGPKTTPAVERTQPRNVFRVKQNIRPHVWRRGSVWFHYTTTESRTLVLTRRFPFVLVLLLGVIALASGGPAVAGAQPVARDAPDPPQSTSALRAAATAGAVSGSRTALVITVALKATLEVPKTVPDKTPPVVAHDAVEISRPWFDRVSHGVFGGYFALSRGPITVQTTAPACSPEWRAEIGNQADDAVHTREPGLEPKNYGVVIYYFGEVKKCSDPNIYAPRGAAGWGDPHRVWLNGNSSLNVAIHELGHNLGLGHSGSQSCTDGRGNQVPLDPNPANCTQEEYGDYFSAMGDHRSGEYSPSQLAQLGWSDGHVTTVTASSATTHYFVSTADGNAVGTTRALRLLDGATTLWLEYRGYADFDESSLNYGLLVRREQPSLAGSPLLLSMNLPDGLFLNTPHPSMIVGQTWADPLGTMQITLDSAGTTGANVTIQPSITFKTVPDLLGRSTTAANNAITAAGLSVGVVNTRFDDPLCEHIGTVITQTPAPGTHRPAGSRVDYVYAIEPSNGCLM